jgi:putative Holliday junction resolvase
MGRILAVDFGTRRVGLAKSDETKTIAAGLPTVTYQNEAELIEKIAGLILELDIERIVVGQPTRLDGTPSQRSQAVEGFAARLAERVRLPVEFFDERFSSIIAQRTLQAQGKKPSRNKALVDELSALVILEGYLERKRCAR